MTIENNIIESVYQTLFSNTNLNNFLNNKKDIYKGTPSQEQANSKNYIVIEKGKRTTTRTLFDGKKPIAKYYTLDILILVNYTQETKQDGLEKFNELIAIIENAMDSSTFITEKIEHIDTDPDIESGKVLQRQSLIAYQFTGTYNTGNL